VISRSRRISFSAFAMSLMIDGWMPSVGSSSSSTFGLRDERAADGELLLLAAREVAALAMAHLEEHREHRVDVLGNHLVLRVLQAGPDVLLHRQRREDHPALRHVAHALRDTAEGFLLRDVGPSTLTLPDFSGRMPIRT
jgi:hypothetical protein